jgi:hypothetical protein
MVSFLNGGVSQIRRAPKFAMDITDAFDEISGWEEQLIAEGEELGLEHGRLLGVEEGRELG